MVFSWSTCDVVASTGRFELGYVPIQIKIRDLVRATLMVVDRARVGVPKAITERQTRDHVVPARIQKVDLAVVNRPQAHLVLRAAPARVRPTNPSLCIPTFEDALLFDDEGPVVTTGDVAEKTGCSQDSARRKLEQLYEQGHVGRRKTAGRVISWRLDAADPNPVNPDDPIFTDRPSFASGIDNLSERVDELLYGKDA